MKLQLALPAALQSAMVRFDAMSLRERALIAMALLASLLVIWDTLLMQPLNARRSALVAILENTDPTAAQTAAPADAGTEAPAADGSEVPTDPDPIGTALLQRESLRTQLTAINRQLQQVSAELIAPERMSGVLYDVLRKQNGVTLISLRNKPVSSLAPAKVPSPNETTPPSDSDQLPSTGPYLHPVELVIEGRYLDILDYVRALEALPWHFQWQALELDGRQPLNRARIELGTLSLDPAWLGT